MSLGRVLRWLQTAALLFLSGTPISIWVTTAQIGFSQKAPASYEPLSKEAVLHWLDLKKVDKNLYNELKLISRISKAGVSFDLGEDDKAAIRKKGGSEELIAAIEAARYRPKTPEAAPVTAPKAAPRREGLLMLTCQPAECLVSINDKPAGKTVNGAYSQKLEEGSATVSATKDDYEPDKKQQVVNIIENKPASVDFKFIPSPKALQREGQKLFEKMMNALGWASGLKTAEIVYGRGTLKSYSEGKITEWDLGALIELPNKGKFNLSGRGQKLEVTRTGDGFEWRKKPQSGVVGELEPCLRWLEDYQIAATVGRLQQQFGGSASSEPARPAAFKMIAEQLSPGAGTPAIFRAVGENETYKITLDPDSRPREIVLESPGLDNGLRIMYSDYTSLQGTSLQGTAYPKSMQVIVAPRQGVEVQFTEVDSSPPGPNKKDKGTPSKPKAPKAE